MRRSVFSGLYAALLMMIFILPTYAGSGTFVIKDANGTSQTYGIGTFGNGNLFGLFGICDFSSCANGLAVNASGQAAIQAPPSLPLPTNAAQETGGNLAQLATDSGAPGSSACASDTGNCNLNQLLQRLAERLTTINTTIGSPLQAGGTLAANQSVNISEINGNTTLTGSGLTGSGSPRVTIAGDPATIAGSTPGTAGSPSANVVTVQGDSGMQPLVVQNEQYTGSAWENATGNIDTGALVTLSGASTGSNSADEINATGRGLKCLVNITAITGTSPTLTVSIDYKDTASNTYTHLLTSAALNAVGATMLTLYPGLTAAANTVADDVLPRTWRISDTIGGTSPAVTATIGCSVLH